MSDTGVRRSSRATKGINTRLEDLEKLEAEAVLSKRRASEQSPNTNVKKIKTTTTNRKRKAPARTTKPEEEVRCLPCGAHDFNYNEEDDELGLMIQCEQCSTWQHAKCMFGTESKKKIPKRYICNVCEPENPKFENLKLALTYEEYLKVRFPGEGEEEEDYEEEEEEDVEEDVEDVGALDNVSDDEYNANGDSENGHTKRHVATKKTTKSPQTKDTTTKNNTRLSVIKQFTKKFSTKVPKDHEVLESKSVDDWSAESAVSLENALYTAYPPSSHGKNDSMSPDYLNKSRTLLFNLEKTNLIDKILSNAFTFTQIVQLTPEEMMRDDYKEFADAVRKQSMSQSILTNTLEKVKIKRTHKGEEIVEEDYQFDDIGSKTADESRLNEIERLQEEKRFKEEQEGKRELSVESDTPPALGGAHLNSNFLTTHSMENDSEDEEHDANGKSFEHDDDDFDKIINDVGKRSGIVDRVPTPPESQAVDENGGEDDDNDSAYDPAESIPIDETLWSGQLEFLPIAELQITAKFGATSAAGDAQDSKVAKSKRIIEDYASHNGSLVVEGRLNDDKANDYLWKIIQTRDLYLIEIVPLHSRALADLENQETALVFKKLWDYFNSRNKYGVIGFKPSYIKDSYLVTVDVEKAKKDGFPKFFKHFDQDKLIERLSAESRSERMFAVFVARKDLNSLLTDRDQNLDRILNSLAA